VVWTKTAGADRINDAQRLQPHLGRDAPIPHAEKPSAGFFLERFM
jgi:hypothetical protein